MGEESLPYSKARTWTIHARTSGIKHSTNLPKFQVACIVHEKGAKGVTKKRIMQKKPIVVSNFPPGTKIGPSRGRKKREGCLGGSKSIILASALLPAVSASCSIPGEEKRLKLPTKVEVVDLWNCHDRFGRVCLVHGRKRKIRFVAARRNVQAAAPLYKPPVFDNNHYSTLKFCTKKTFWPIGSKIRACNIQIYPQKRSTILLNVPLSRSVFCIDVS